MTQVLAITSHFAKFKGHPHLNFQAHPMRAHPIMRSLSRTAEWWCGVRCGKMSGRTAHQRLGAQRQPCSSHPRTTPAANGIVQQGEVKVTAGFQEMGEIAFTCHGQQSHSYIYNIQIYIYTHIYIIVTVVILIFIYYCCQWLEHTISTSTTFLKFISPSCVSAATFSQLKIRNVTTK